MSYECLPLDAWETAAASADLESRLLTADLVRTIRHAMAELTPRQRAVLDLAYREGLTHAEMAVRLRRPLGTVKTWVRGAMQSLRAVLSEEGFQPAGLMK
jgi:RNA polymerase sigma factor (sigma-70 family)